MSTRHVSENSLYIPNAHANSFMYSFVLNTAATFWNGLPHPCPLLAVLRTTLHFCFVETLFLALYHAKCASKIHHCIKKGTINECW